MLNKSIWRTSNKLQLMHANIFGPTKPNSDNNKRYILSFIYDFTCKTWIYFLDENSEAFAMSRKFKASVEKESSEYITSLRTYRGGEFASNKFEEFGKVQGISGQLTWAYTPQ